jgi:hypothetical protein
MARHSGRAESAGWLMTIKQGEAFRALRNRDYRLLWIGQLGHSAALWVETVARSWLIWELTGSATLLATVNLLRAIPMLILGLFAGVAADRFDKRKLLIITRSVTLANYLVMATLITTGAVQVWHVRHNGEIRWNGEFIYVSEALAGEPVALKQKGEHLWEIRFSSYPLGVFNELTMKITPILSKEGREVLPMCPV